jgi:hypothetical protein
MTITELIAKLEELKADHGDVNVVYRAFDDGGTSNIDRFVPNYPYKWGVEDKTQPAYEIELI